MILADKLNDWNLILASGSPRRKELMAGCGLTFTVADKFGVREAFPASMAPHDVPLFLAHVKSDAYPIPLGGRDILITADTIVILDGEILGKPKDADDAVAMLGKLAGRGHTVVSGVVLRGANGRTGFSATSQVRFAPLSGEQIRWYVERFMPMDKAGSYAIQEWIGYVGIEAIEGSFYNVMGLPTQQLCAALEDFTEGKQLKLL